MTKVFIINPAPHNVHRRPQAAAEEHQIAGERTAKRAMDETDADLRAPWAHPSSRRVWRTFVIGHGPQEPWLHDTTCIQS